jgi:DNA-binding CsgD family transcriptional regulator
VADSLRQLTEAVSILSDEARVLELAVAAMHEACPRGAAFGATSRGDRSNRLGLLRAMKGGALVPTQVPHLAWVRTPPYDVAAIPMSQRNRWIEPFREGIATPEGFKSSTVYPFVKHLGIVDQGRIIVCCGARQVAFVGAGVPEGTTFSGDERERLIATSDALVVPLRMAAVLAASATERSPLEKMLDVSDEAVVAVDSNGAIVDTSPVASALLRTDRSIPDRIRDAVRVLRRTVAVVRADDYVIHVSQCAADRAVAYLVVIDGSGFAEPPVPLTERQLELIGHLRRGLSNAEIAAAMGNAPSTVKTMLERLYQRAGVANRVELLAWAKQHGS